MSAAAILSLAMSLLTSAVPELLALYDRIKSGGSVTDAEVDAIFAKYGIDRQALVAATS